MIQVSERIINFLLAFQKDFIDFIMKMPRKHETTAYTKFYKLS